MIPVMYRQSYVVHLLGCQLPQVPISSWTNKPTVSFILNEGMRGEHKRITARFFPTDGAVSDRFAG